MGGDEPGRRAPSDDAEPPARVRGADADGGRPSTGGRGAATDGFRPAAAARGEPGCGIPSDGAAASAPGGARRGDAPAAAPEPRAPGELAFACGLLAFATAALWQAHGISGLMGLSEPGVFPMLAAGAMVAAALVATLRIARRPRAPGGALTHALPGRVALLTALVAGFALAMPWLGFMVSAGLFLALAVGLLWRRGPLVTLAVTAASLLGLWLIFRVAFQVVLPQGTLLRGLL